MSGVAFENRRCARSDTTENLCSRFIRSDVPSAQGGRAQISINIVSKVSDNESYWQSNNFALEEAIGQAREKASK